MRTRNSTVSNYLSTQLRVKKLENNLNNKNFKKEVKDKMDCELYNLEMALRGR
jgi:hypothetical protein